MAGLEEEYVDDYSTFPLYCRTACELFDCAAEDVTSDMYDIGKRVALMRLYSGGSIAVQTMINSLLDRWEGFDSGQSA